MNYEVERPAGLSFCNVEDILNLHCIGNILERARRVTSL
jgi:hypothetical protein